MRLPVQLNYRERIAVCSALLLVSVLIIAEWGVFPVIRYRKTLDQEILTRALELEEIQKLQKTHALLTQNTEGIRSRLSLREKDFTLFSYLDRSAGNAGVKEHIAYMKPSGSDLQSSAFKFFQVEIKFQSITMHQLSSFLYGVETADRLVKVKKAAIVKSDFSKGGLETRPYIDAILWVETIAP
jgi:general secretion pathway protein M